MTPLIINRPDLRSFQQKYGQSLLTLLIWVMFFFFMRPLIGLIGWFFGLQLFADVMIVHGGYQALIELLGIYFGIIVCMGLILEGWALYNQLRYGRNEKRNRHPAPLSLADQARHFEISGEQLEHWQTARSLVLEHDDQGRLTGGSIPDPDA
ncbi:MAG TPA: poly-beta-1,6-N-acetyl-D-glucosamine biosynthesis protein PgaD [Geothermobacteraceae bacterium]|nr:poly-beta-1,6-N-acetyl-D-glucosamine biosynthesis protein PgaD [Geothermobacteraceae bacterium]